MMFCFELKNIFLKKTQSLGCEEKKVGLELEKKYPRIRKK